MREIKFENFSFVILDRHSCCRASTLTLNRYDSIEIFVEF